MNTPIGTHSHSNPPQGPRWFQTLWLYRPLAALPEFQSALRFAVVSDPALVLEEAEAE